MTKKKGNSTLSRDGDVADCCFAVFSDEAPSGSGRRPLAIFDTLESAMDWGLERFKGGSFRLRFGQFLYVPEDQPRLRQVV